MITHLLVLDWNNFFHRVSLNMLSCPELKLFSASNTVYHEKKCSTDDEANNLCTCCSFKLYLSSFISCSQNIFAFLFFSKGIFDT